MSGMQQLARMMGKAGGSRKKYGGSGTPGAAGPGVPPIANGPAMPGADNSGSAGPIIPPGMNPASQKGGRRRRRTGKSRKHATRSYSRTHKKRKNKRRTHKRK
jgi:hypothetical protein